MKIFELVIQKATELGVNNIYPIITELTNHKFDKKGFDKKIERWHKIAISATEQMWSSVHTQNTSSNPAK